MDTNAAKAITDLILRTKSTYNGLSDRDFRIETIQQIADIETLTLKITDHWITAQWRLTNSNSPFQLRHPTLQLTQIGPQQIRTLIQNITPSHCLYTPIDTISLTARASRGWGRGRGGSRGRRR